MGQPGDDPLPRAALGDLVEPRQVLRAGEPGVVEREVDHEPPGAGACPEVVVGQPARVADVAEDQVHGPP